MGCRLVRSKWMLPSVRVPCQAGDERRGGGGGVWSSGERGCVRCWWGWAVFCGWVRGGRGVGGG
eukprot:1517869-Rhodomonas_salina.1